MTRKHLLRLICFLLSATLLLSTAVSASAGKLIGNKIKNFKTKTITGETFELNKALEENAAVIIDLWFIDCDWCAQTFYYWEQCDSCYRDQVAFLALNITDKIEDIADYAETRGFSDDIVFARDAGIRSTVRANTFPRSILVGKGGVILDDDLDSSCFQAAIRYAAGLTDQDYADIAEWVKKDKKKADEWFTLANYNSSDAYILDEHYDSLEEGNRRWNDRTNRDYSYSPEDKLSFEVQGDGLHQIVITENENALKRNTKLTRFYLVPEGTVLSVRVTLGKKMNVKKAFTEGLNDFSSAVKEDKYTYIFETSAIDLQTRFIHPSEDSRADGYSGFITFSSEESAAWYFKNISRDIGYPVSWQLAD